MYTNAVLPVALYGCETWSRILKEERTMREIENRVLRNVFGPKKRGKRGLEETTWRGTSCSLFCTKHPGDQIKNNEMGMECDIMGESTSAYTILMG